VLLHRLTGKPYMELRDALEGLAPDRRERLDALAIVMLSDDARTIGAVMDDYRPAA